MKKLLVACAFLGIMTNVSWAGEFGIASYYNYYSKSGLYAAQKACLLALMCG